MSMLTSVSAIIDRFKESPTEQCPVCLDVIVGHAISLDCYHEFCKECITKCLSNSSKCPICRVKLTTLVSKKENDEIFDILSYVQYDLNDIRHLNFNRGSIQAEMLDARHYFRKLYLPQVHQVFDMLIKMLAAEPLIHEIHPAGTINYDTFNGLLRRISFEGPRDEDPVKFFLAFLIYAGYLPAIEKKLEKRNITRDFIRERPALANRLVQFLHGSLESYMLACGLWYHNTSLYEDVLLQGKPYQLSDEILSSAFRRKFCRFFTSNEQVCHFFSEDELKCFYIRFVDFAESLHSMPANYFTSSYFTKIRCQEDIDGAVNRIREQGLKGMDISISVKVLTNSTNFLVSSIDKSIEVITLDDDWDEPKRIIPSSILQGVDPKATMVKYNTPNVYCSVCHGSKDGPQHGACLKAEGGGGGGDDESPGQTTKNKLTLDKRLKMMRCRNARRRIRELLLELSGSGPLSKDIVKEYYHNDIFKSIVDKNSHYRERVNGLIRKHNLATYAPQ